MSGMSFATAENDFFRAETAERYAAEDFRFLFPPEAAILETLAEQGLDEMAMLDLGVGGGRTTEHFAPRVRRYVGLDCSAAMIDVCRRRFGEGSPTVELVIGDACALSYPDRSFDFLLFSFNGLDDVDGEGRIAALREARRVLRDDGWFAFSTHNIGWTGLHSLYEWTTLRSRLPDLSAFFKELKLQCVLRRANRTLRVSDTIDALRRRGHGMFYDTSGVRGYYVSNDFQLAQLAGLGFDRVRTFAVDGKETSLTRELDAGYQITYLARPARAS